MTDLTSLIEKLEKAERPDRELDCQIAVAVDGFYELPPKWDEGPVGYGYIDAEGTPIHPGHGGDQLVRRYTSSIDAAVSLAERVLPNLSKIQPETYVGGEFHHCEIETEEGDFEAHNCPNPAIAICLATLRALQSRGDA